MKAWIDMILQHQFPSGQLRTAEEYITLLSNLKSCEDIAEAEFNAWMSILMRIKKKLGRKQALQELQGLKTILVLCNVWRQESHGMNHIRYHFYFLVVAFAVNGWQKAALKTKKLPFVNACQRMRTMIQKYTLIDFPVRTPLNER
eukprot:scaffold192296_cov17-Tisochrysis_lutea.AAC.1